MLPTEAGGNISTFGWRYYENTENTLRDTFQLALAGGGQRFDLPKGHGMGSLSWAARDARAVVEGLDLSKGGTAIVAWLANNPRFATYDAAGKGTPLWEVIPKVRANVGSVVASSEETFGVAYLDVFTDSPTIVNRLSSKGDSHWLQDAPTTTHAYIDSASAGGQYVLALSELFPGPRRVSLYDDRSGDLLWTTSFSSPRGVNGLDVDAAGTTIWVGTPADTYVLDGATGQMLQSFGGKTCCHGGYFIRADSLSKNGQRGVAWQDGNVTLYERGGDTYVPKWTANTGRQAIRTATISGNGEVIMVGAHNWVSASPNPGVACDRERLLLYRANSPNTAWFYDLYGGKYACISDIAITPDGTRAAVVSWGSSEQEANADDLLHDVLTVFDTRWPTPVPLFRLLDDIDETGTLWDVAISDDGKYVVAGGSSRHISTYLFGGMVYSIEMLV